MTEAYPPASPARLRHRVSLATVDGRLGALVVFLASLACFGLQSLAVSLTLGRDAEDYLIDGWEMFARHPLFPHLMLARTPVSGLAIDLFDRLGGVAGVEVGLGMLFAFGVLCWVSAARAYGRKAAGAMFVLLAVLPAYGLFFHRVSSDPVFASVLGLVALFAVRLAKRPTLGRSVALALAVSLLILTRPSGQPFLLLAVLPLVLGGPWRVRLWRAAAFCGVAVAVLGAWAVSNSIRYGELTVAHGGKSGVPLYRVFVIDPEVSRANGPASRKVASAVEKRLLDVEPYRSYGFDVDEILAAGNTWALDDVVGAVESEYGPREGSDLLFRTGVEAIRAARGHTRKASRWGSPACCCSPTPRRSRATGPPPSRGRRSATPSSGRPDAGAACPPTSSPPGHSGRGRSSRAGASTTPGGTPSKAGCATSPTGSGSSSDVGWSGPTPPTPRGTPCSGSGSAGSSRTRRAAIDARGSAGRYGWGRSSCRRAGSGSSSPSCSA